MITKAWACSNRIGTIAVALVLSASGIATAADNSSSGASADSGPALNEIVVTAQKREERLQDVPIPVSVIGAAELTESNQLLLQEYFDKSPGISLSPASQSQQNIAIRGITTGIGTGNPTVGIVVDDVPYGSELNQGGGFDVPDIDPGELQRVEVLRGPQGTLYGASSIGGLIKFVTVDPSTDALSGRIQSGISNIHGSSDIGYNVRGSVNIPVTDTLAVRASAFTREDPGYIDNPLTGVNGLNEAHVSGGRAAALWRPSDVLSIKLSALYQNTVGGGSNDVDDLANFQQSYGRGMGAYERSVQLYTAKIDWKISGVDLASITGYSIKQSRDSIDYTGLLGPVTFNGAGIPGQTGFGTPYTAFYETEPTRKFSQEFRVITQLGSKVDWLVGAFYSHEANSPVQYIDALNNFDDAKVVGVALLNAFPTTSSDLAGFTDFTIHFTDQFDLQLGGREARNIQSLNQTDSGMFTPVFFGEPSPFIRPELTSNQNAFTYLATPQFRFSPSLMAYARIASGYTPGGPNANIAPGVPNTYSSDKTTDYDIGAKGDFLDHLISFDASIYYIDWKNPQFGFLTTGVAPVQYTGNGGKAKSQGVELSGEFRPITGLKVAAWVSFGDAVLTENLPPAAVANGTYGAKGDRLPDSARFTGNVSTDYDFPIANNFTGNVGAGVSYVGNRQGVFPASAATPRAYYPAYAKTDAHAALKYGPWSANLFMNNITNRRGLLSDDPLPVEHYYLILPRLIGLNVSRTF
jgi:outer membrane receptor protein involved in Fe transport